MRKENKQPGFRKTLRNRLVFISLLFAFYFMALSSRLFYLQVIKHDELLSRSERQYASTAKIFYGRGNIYDRNGNTLAQNIEVESVYVNPAEVYDPERVAKVLSSTLGMDQAQMLTKISAKKHFVWIKRKCNIREVENLKQYDLSGVGFVSEQKRFYPKRELASAVIGFVGLDNQGLSGVEHFHQDKLKGKTVRKVMEKDARGRPIRSLIHSPGGNAQTLDIVLTIDEVIQFITEYHLKKQVEKYNARAGIAIVMDPYSGEILALANVPQYNPNNFQAYSPAIWTNKAVAGSYEPGSIFKPIVAAAAIDSGKARPNDIFFCENGRFKIGRTSIGEASNHKFGWMSLKSIISKSSNIGSIKIAQKVGQSTYFDYITRFGFGSRTGIDLPGESPGLLQDISRWSALSLASISFGHEIAVTPIQMVTALSAIANGGNLMRPQITRSFKKNGVVIKKIKPRLVRRVISEKTSRQMIDILKTVVKSGTGGNAAIEGFDSAGKTGTAQKYDPKTRTYSQTDYIASFIGFVPADAPRIVVLVMIDGPENKYWGGTVAAPVFREISKQTLRYLNVPSNKERVYILDRA